MLVIVGFLIVAVCVVTGFILAGGNLLVLLQWSEFIIIGGAALGSFLIGSPMEVVKKVIKAIPGTMKSHSFSKQDYLEMLKAFNDLFLVAQRDGLLSIESHVEKPEESTILSKSSKLMHSEHMRNFFCDTMKVMLSGGIPPHELDMLIDMEIETFEAEQKPVGHAINKIGDALPGLGIVAAVLGIIVTMGSINDGAEAVGHHVAAALVGTFLGVLLAYGFIGPLASNIEHSTEESIQHLITIKTCIVAYAKGNPPIMAVEMARRTIFSDSRPTFSELENYMRGKSE